jgi:hypothetical protein
MRTLGHHASIATYIDSINSRMAALASSFAAVEQRTAADDALIDILSAQAERPSPSGSGVEDDRLRTACARA